MKSSSVTSSSAPKFSAQTDLSVTAVSVSRVRRVVVAAWVRRARTRLRLPAGTISIVFCRPSVIRAANRRYRGKNVATNVLTFVFPPSHHLHDRELGEILLCPSVIRREARRYRQSYRSRLKFLLEHGMIHLRGLDHQTTAEQHRWERWERRLTL